MAGTGWDSCPLSLPSDVEASLGGAARFRQCRGQCHRTDPPHAAAVRTGYAGAGLRRKKIAGPWRERKTPTPQPGRVAMGTTESRPVLLFSPLVVAKKENGKDDEGHVQVVLSNNQVRVTVYNIPVDPLNPNGIRSVHFHEIIRIVQDVVVQNRQKSKTIDSLQLTLPSHVRLHGTPDGDGKMLMDALNDHNVAIAEKRKGSLNTFHTYSVNRLDVIVPKYPGDLCDWVHVVRDWFPAVKQLYLHLTGWSGTCGSKEGATSNDVKRLNNALLDCTHDLLQLEHLCVDLQDSVWKDQDCVERLILALASQVGGTVVVDLRVQPTHTRNSEMWCTPDSIQKMQNIRRNRNPGNMVLVVGDEVCKNNKRTDTLMFSQFPIQAVARPIDLLPATQRSNFWQGVDVLKVWNHWLSTATRNSQPQP